MICSPLLLAEAWLLVRRGSDKVIIERVIGAFSVVNASEISWADIFKGVVVFWSGCGMQRFVYGDCLLCVDM